MPQKKEDEKEGRGKLIQSLVTMLLSLLVLLFGVYAWFANNRTVTADGMQITVADKSLKIAKAEGGDDILTFADAANQKLILTVTGSSSADTEIFPGSSGSFSAYLTVRGSNVLKITPEVLPGGVQLVSGADGSVAASSVTSYRESFESNTKAKDFLQGHILLFQKKENGVYSGWLNPYDGTDLSFTPKQEKKLTVYWVWADSADKLLTEGGTLIAEDDFAAIRRCYRDDTGNYTERAKTNLFDLRGSDKLTEQDQNLYYDYADEEIGKAIAHIHFRLTFSFMTGTAAA